MHALVVAMILLASTQSVADPLGDTAKPAKYVQTTAPRLLCLPPAPPATCIELPAGRFVSEDGWSRLDVEFKRLQDGETRLTAQNKALRGSLSTWSPGWVTLASVFVVGVSAGVYVTSKL